MSLLAAVRRARGAAVLAAVACAVATTPAAWADSTADAQRDVDRILARVHALQADARRAEAAYERTLSGVARAVTLSSLTERAHDRVAQQAAAAQAALNQRVAGLYMSGGPLSLYAAVLQTGDVNDFQASGVLVDSMLSANRLVVRRDRAVVDAAAAQAAGADRAATRRLTTARDVARVAQRMERLLAEQQALLDRANTRLGHLQALDAARAALAAQSAAIGSITSSTLLQLHVLPPSPLFLSLYHRAADTCGGLSWTVLAAIGQVESGHGRNPSTSYAGAMGPMQFLPSTFAAYAVDGDGDGTADIMDPADAIFTAAHYLCANGAGHGSDALFRAIWHYNHADWYVRMVLALADRYAG